MKHDDVYLRHMLEAVEDILTYSAEGKAWFLQSRMGQQAIVRNFEIIGEAASKISADTKAKYPEMPWREVKDFRNHLIHEYFDVDLTVVWSVLDSRLPIIKPIIEKILHTLTNGK